MSDEDEPVIADDEAAEDGSPVIDSATDPRAHRRKRTKANQQRAEARAFWSGVLATEVGRREIWKLLAHDGHCFDTRFACGPNGFPQGEATWFHAGEQALALRVYHSLVLYDRAGVFLMHDEHDPRFADFKQG